MLDVVYDCGQPQQLEPDIIGFGSSLWASRLGTVLGESGGDKVQPLDNVQGRISKAGDPDVGRDLYEAGAALIARFKGKAKLRSWELPVQHVAT